MGYQTNGQDTDTKEIHYMVHYWGRGGRGLLAACKPSLDITAFEPDIQSTPLM